ncbi:MAG: hypothetical protein AAF634_14555 [Bacteroidota bacterium]
MRNLTYLRICSGVALLVTLSVFQLCSCSSDSDDRVVENENPGPGANEDPAPEPEPIMEDVVQTLVANFGANDGLSVAADGTIYASNFGSFTGTQVLAVNPETGVVEVAVDNLQAPTGNCIDAEENIYVVHNVRRTAPESNATIGDVIRVDSDGNRTTLATLPGFPSGITLDDEGNLYVSNFAFPGVHRISAEGETTIYVQDNRLAGGVGIDFDENGNLFVGNFTTGDILEIAPDTSIEVLVTLPTDEPGVVIGYITYLNGSIYATAPGEHVIYEVSLSGEASVLAGSGSESTRDGSLTEASFDTPNGIVGDANRNVLYVTESENLRVIDLN